MAGRKTLESGCWKPAETEPLARQHQRNVFWQRRTDSSKLWPWRLDTRIEGGAQLVAMPRFGPLVTTETAGNPLAALETVDGDEDERGGPCRQAQR